ncbi:zinc-dependent alcohol dehydrogenase family protein [Isosphaeraceae bacterium EP7]
MRAMVLRSTGSLDENPSPLEAVDWPDPIPKQGEILIRVRVCGVCHTELDEIEGRTPPSVLPVILGHQVVGHVEALGEGVTDLKLGNRVGVAWIFSACGVCPRCQRGEENLCTRFRATGRDANGGYAERMTVASDFAYRIPNVFCDEEAAPLLCAGAIGYRSLRLTELVDGQTLGLTGFGGSGHLVLKLVKHRFPRSKIFVFARDESERAIARELGATWAGNTRDAPPELMQAVIDTTPAWEPVVAALEHLEPGGRLVINAIRKEEKDKKTLLTLDYARHLWFEKEIKSVANVTRDDVREFLREAAEIPIRPEVTTYPLEEANRALNDLKSQAIRGAKVLMI